MEARKITEGQARAKRRGQDFYSDDEEEVGGKRRRLNKKQRRQMKMMNAAGVMMLREFWQRLIYLSAWRVRVLAVARQADSVQLAKVMHSSTRTKQNPQTKKTS